VSVRQLADELKIRPPLLHYYLKQIGVQPLYVGNPANAPRFIHAHQVVDVVNAIHAYRQRRPVPGFTTEEAARELGLSVNTIRVLVATRKLRPRKVRGRLSFSPAELQRYDRQRGRRVA
jgi:excisionase family DNA binding protein